MAIVVLAVSAYATTTISDKVSTLGGDTNLNGNLTLPLNDSTLKLYSSAFLIPGSGPNPSIQLIGERKQTKPSIVWDSWDEPTQQFRSVGWMTCHYNLDGGPTNHSHCSIETLDNITGTPNFNTKFEVTYGGNVTEGVVGIRNSRFELSTGKKMWFTTGARNSSISYNNPVGGLLYDSPQHRFISGDVELISSDLELDSGSSVYIQVDRGGTSSYGSLYFATAGANKWAIQTRADDSSHNLYIRDQVSSKNAITFELASLPIINMDGLTIITPNSTAISCGSSQKGAIYFDGTTNKHYGCDGSAWNALY